MLTGELCTAWFDLFQYICKSVPAVPNVRSATLWMWAHTLNQILKRKKKWYILASVTDQLVEVHIHNVHEGFLAYSEAAIKYRRKLSLTLTLKFTVSPTHNKNKQANKQWTCETRVELLGKNWSSAEDWWCNRTEVNQQQNAFWSGPV